MRKPLFRTSLAHRSEFQTQMGYELHVAEERSRVKFNVQMGCLIGLLMLETIAIALMWGFGFSTIPFLLIFAGGYFYVGFASLHALAKMNQEAAMEAALAESAEPAST